jgi:hypothetical protein
VWITTDEMLVAYVEAIIASVSVLISGLGLHFIWLYVIVSFRLTHSIRQRKRFWLVTASSVLMLFALCFLPYTGSTDFFTGIEHIFTAVVAFLWTPMLGIFIPGFSPAALLHFVLIVFPPLPRSHPSLKRRFWNLWLA